WSSQPPRPGPLEKHPPHFAGDHVRSTLPEDAYAGCAIRPPLPSSTVKPGTTAVPVRQTDYTLFFVPVQGAAELAEQDQRPFASAARQPPSTPPAVPPGQRCRCTSRSE